MKIKIKTAVFVVCHSLVGFLSLSEELNLAKFVTIFICWSVVLILFAEQQSKEV